MQPEEVQIPHHPQRMHRRQHSHSHGKMPQSNMIIVYTTVVCLCCLYLQTQHFQYILGDRRAHYMAMLTYIDVFMCLWSYYRTIKIGNSPSKLSRLEKTFAPPADKFYDLFYSPTHKYCTECKYFKYPRVSHCSTCGKCIYKMDHHCIWTQTCIGFSNQKCFYLFCVYMSLGVLQFWYFNVRIFSQKTESIFSMAEPGVIIIWFFTAFSAFFVGLMIMCLVVGHTAMMFTNFRTMDSMKQKKCFPVPFFNKGTSVDQLNLFDRGQVQNIKQFFGQKWYLWLIPTERLVENDLYPETLAPHPQPYKLMQETPLYEIELKYKEQMKRLPQANLLQFFTGKKVKINDSVFLLCPDQKEGK